MDEYQKIYKENGGIKPIGYKDVSEPDPYDEVILNGHMIKQLYELLGGDLEASISIRCYESASILCAFADCPEEGVWILHENNDTREVK